MSPKRKKPEPYKGFEQGPIRPPSEAYSLLIRVTRNCPWNRCTFCPVYKRSKFSLRPVEHVKQDIDTVHKYVEILRQLADEFGRMDRAELSKVMEHTDPGESPAFHAALQWLGGGLKSVFIQDANSLIIKPSDMVEIMTHLKQRFPWVERITSYARSHTVARIKDEDLKAIREAGLNRIHIGLESGSDKVLKLIKKGVTKETHIKAGQKVKKAGMELSEYVMPGLGGKQLSKEHALETADALNQINADFIRLRTLAIPRRAAMYEDYQAGRFEKCTDLMTAKEILLFLENLNGITSMIKSDHILNLFQDVEGKLPDDKADMINIVKTFLNMDPERQRVYQIGRRIGVFSGIRDMEDPARLRRAEKTCDELQITEENVDAVTDELMNRFV
ncbi:radical SAM protein [Desulfonema magnum]|uniref:Radical SAM domain-containing protein n=1 Tax=Desulfonema magnum TaxID=45655 RepID=A0A975GNE9_9BACT|nr:radical SAM protein [Desulfonema magnum]QTA87705.1 Radical SAM domain-containing protein [Desulfonema magnum]